ncbi:MAG: DUF5302 domain-containing protein [Aeromicrobium sp.]|uniref:DUF5302 domain-containing protein n=1 Tax=Aeromicrobium sp. TaxID=1871063 RepID=UPI003C432ACF
MTDSANPDSSNEALKAKMREALEKKNKKHHPSPESAEHDGSEKSHGADKPIAQPEFRRKSI